MKRSQQNMLNGSLFTGVLRYAIPVVLTSVLQLLFNAADLVVVGQFSGSICVGAVGATGPIINLIVNLFVGLSLGAGVTTAHAVGSGNAQDMHRTVHTAMATALASGVILTAVGILLAEPMLVRMDTPASVLPLSSAYMRIYFAGITFTMVYNYAAAILRAAGDTKSPLLFLGISGVLNVGLNLLFVAVLGMNVDGVALATVISQCVSAILVTAALMHRKDGCRLMLKKLRFYKKQLGKMIYLGVPAGLQGIMFSISNVMIQSSVNSFGDVVVSGSAAASNLEGFVYVSMNAFQQAALNFTGQNMGAVQYDRVKKTRKVCMFWVSVVGVVLGVGIYLLGPWLLPIYLKDSPQAVYYGTVKLGFVCMPYFLLGLSDVLSGSMRGMGESLAPMLISVLGICGIRLLWIATIFKIQRFHSFNWLMASYPISWVITLVLDLVLCAYLFRKKLKGGMPPLIR